MGTSVLLKLKAQMETAVKDMETARKMLSEATEAGDESKMELRQKAFEDAKAQVETVKKDLELEIASAKQYAAIGGLYDEIGTLTKAQTPDGEKSMADGAGSRQDAGEEDANGGQPDGTKQHAAPMNWEKKEAEREELFYKYLQGGPSRMSDRELDEMQPQSEKLLGRGEGVVCTIPMRLFAKMLGAQVETKALPMKTSDGSDAGGRSYLFWDEHDTTLGKLPHEPPTFFDLVRKMPLSGTDTYKMTQVDQDDSEFGGVAVSRGTEGADANATEEDFKELTIKTYPMDAITRISNRLLRTSRFNLEQEVVGAMRAAFRRQVNYEVIHGTGVSGSQCLGVRQADSVTAVNRQTSSTVTYTDLLNLEYEVRRTIRLGAIFALSDTVEKHLKQKTISSDGTTDQRPLFSATTGSGPHDRLDNYPWTVGTSLSTLGTAGDVIFGNWRHYLLLIQQEAVISRSTERYFEKGQTAIRIDADIGGKPVHGEAFAYLTDVSS